MINVDEKVNCCGCTACASVCPKHCITMKPDEEGFLYPVIDTAQCISCSQCEKVCPVQNPFHANEKTLPDTVAVRIKDNAVLYQCTSGGAFTALANEIVKAGGIAVGAAFDNTFQVCHVMAETQQDIARLTGSKYVQSNLGDIFPQIRQKLLDGKTIIFCGTPCQTAGLKYYLKKDYDNLLLIDLVCHGVPSPKLWADYIAYRNKKMGQHEKITFRSKRFGYHVTAMAEEFANRKVEYRSARTNLMLKCFYNGLGDRPICYQCPFKTVQRCSDLTIFDCWHIEQVADGVKDDDKGYSNVMIQSEKGRKYLAQYGNQLIQYKVDTEKVIKLDGKKILESVKRPSAREEFYVYFNENGIEKTVARFMPITRKDYMIEKSKMLLDKMGILRSVKSLKSKHIKRKGN